MTGVITAEEDRALKTKHRTMWAWGDYPKVAVDLIAELGPAMVAAAGVSAGQRVLDVAAGSGNAAIPAAETLSWSSSPTTTRRWPTPTIRRRPRS